MLSKWNCLGKIRRVGFAGVSVTLLEEVCLKLLGTTMDHDTQTTKPILRVFFGFFFFGRGLKAGFLFTGLASN